MDSFKHNNTRQDAVSPGKLFVYGTLRSHYGHTLSYLIKDYFELAGEGFIRGDLFDIGNYPGAVDSGKNNHRITGEIYRAKNGSDICTVFKVLDEYEGYDPSRAGDSEYVRKRKWVQLKNGLKMLSWVYMYNWPVAGKPLIAGGDYLRHLARKKIS